MLVSNQVRGAAKIDRLAQLPKLGARTLCCVDDVDNVADLSAAAQTHGTTIEVLVEIDCGAGRCGVNNSGAVVEIAKAVDAAEGLRFSGIQAYQGAMQHMDKYEDRKAKIDIAVAMVRDAVDTLKAEGLTCDIVGGGGTGSYYFEGNSGVYNELQCGSYAFMDADYGRILDKDGKPKMIKVMIPGAVEAVDKYTVRFNLKKPVLSVAEDCYNYPTGIVHSSFKPPFSDKPIGTGPFTLVSLAVGDKCILKRVTEMSNGQPFKYWGGKVYLDQIDYYNFASDNQLTAFAGGDADAIYSFGVEQIELAKSLDGNILSTSTAQTLVCRMNVTKAPYTDARLRQAVVKAVDNARIMELVYPTGAALGENHHVAPLHPEYFALPPLKRDVAGAKKLLADAGYADGLELTINVGNTDGPWHQAVAEAMRDQLKDVGIKLNVNVMPESKYWGVWTSAPFSATSWTHRPLGTMVLSLAYRTGVPWNESGYSNKDFEAALDKAEATLDVAKRKALMEKVEKILQDDTIMVQPLWRPVYTIVAKKVNGYPAHPTQYHQFNKVWLSA